MRKGSVGVGFRRGTRVRSIADQATRAMAEGRQVFVCRVYEGGPKDGWSGSLSGMAEQIEAVEAAGWSLVQSSFLQGRWHTVAAFLIFRRGGS